MIQKIISGGQTGVDQAALDVAIELGIECGGWCPPGRECDEGIIVARYPLTETPVERSSSAPDIPRSLRTEWNVRDSDATLILKPNDVNDKGTEWTIQCAINYKKPHFIIDPFKKDSIIKIKSWLKSYEIKVLNVAGHSENTCRGIGTQVYRILTKALSE